MADQEAHAQARQAVGLGEGAQHGHVGAVAIQVDAVGDIGVADVLAVGLVQDDQAVGRRLVEEFGQLALADDGAGGVVRVADQDEPGLRGDRGGHRGQVVSLVPERHAHRGGAREVGQRRVSLERAPGVDDLRPGVADGPHQLLQHAHRAAADGDMPDRNGEPLGDRLGQRARAAVRVAVDAAAGLRDHLHDGRQRPVRRLVGRQLVRLADRGGRRLAGLVGGHGVQHRTESRRYVSHVDKFPTSASLPRPVRQGRPGRQGATRPSWTARCTRTVTWRRTCRPARPVRAPRPGTRWGRPRSPRQRTPCPGRRATTGRPRCRPRTGRSASWPASRSR